MKYIWFFTSVNDISGCKGFQDIVFSVDRSGSISLESLNNLESVLRGVIDLLNVDDGTNPPGSYRVGVQSFNDAQIVHKQLIVPGGSFGDIPDPSGGTNIAAAVK